MNITINCTLPKLDSFGYITVADSMGLALISLTLAPNDTESGEIMQNYSQYAVQGHSGSLISLPMESLYVTDFLIPISE